MLWYTKKISNIREGKNRHTISICSYQISWREVSYALCKSIVGNGKQTRDFIHVYDLVDAILKAAKSKYANQIYNIGSGKETSVNKIASLIGGNKIYIPKRPGEPDRSCADIKKIRSHLKWKPKINIEQGVKTLLNSIADWKNSPVWTPKKIRAATKDWFKTLKKK